MTSCVITYLSTEHILGQQAHEVAGGVGVEAERRDEDVSGSVSPVLVVILHPVQNGVSYGGLRVDHLACRKTTKEVCSKRIICFISSPVSHLH